MRVAGLFNRLLGSVGVRVVGISVDVDGGEQVVLIDVARRKNRRMFCSGCDQRSGRGGTSTCSAFGVGFAVRCVASAPGVWCDRRVGAVCAGWVALDEGVRGFGGVACQSRPEDGGRGAASGGLGDGRQDDRTGRLRAHPHPRRRRVGRPETYRDRRGRLPQRAPVPDVRRVPRHRPGRVGRARPIPSHNRGVLPATRSGAVQPAHRGVGRSARRVVRGDTPLLPQRPGVRRPLPRDQARRRRPRRAPPRAVAEPPGNRSGSGEVVERNEVHPPAPQRPLARRRSVDPRSAR